ncbi:MAG TPA: LytR family transcriptional regulator [Lachnoclostridium phytofermentans]|uniref:LytR family transcriptional regulator n=2 Tax=Lachnoclostridium TaxID=1506553 RepID=A0A3D2X7U4_9FIRM|nr:LytR family transcriptional regulator [Lachnoclostridium phytofermentans]
MGNNKKKKKNKKKKALIITYSILGTLLLAVALIFGTPGGRKLIYNAVGGYVSGRIDNVEAENKKPSNIFGDNENEDFVNTDPNLRKEKYVANFLIAGIEEIGGGGRTDSMMLVSVNKKDNTIKLTSIMRDCYVEIPGNSPNKLNAAYSIGGMDLLVDTVQQNFKIKIDGYATVNFNNFENIVNILGGVDIELGSEEARYLNTTNYISNPAYRNVKPGMNHLNGNQALGYSRVRKVVTLGGANNDFGRTLRQRRVLNAIFEEYKSKNLFELMSIMDQILPYIKTDLTGSEISDLLQAVVENKIFTIENNRIPAEDYYTAGRNERGSVLILDFEANIKELYRTIFLDEEVTPTPEVLIDIPN